MKPYVLLVFVLKGGTNFAACVTRACARSSVADFALGKMPGIVTHNQFDCHPDVIGFAIRAEEVQAISIQEMPAQQQPTPPVGYPPYGGRS